VCVHRLVPMLTNTERPVDGHVAPLPLLPGPTVFYHWDHHWIAWTPGDRMYESIEVMTVETRGMPGSRLVWAFLTERAAPKRQVHYLNDPGVAARWRGEAYPREFDFAADGLIGTPRRLRVAFRDKSDRQVEWVLDFDEHTELIPVGLKDQSGHEAERFFLLYHCGRGRSTDSSWVTIDGQDVGCRASGTSGIPFAAAYGYDIYIVSLIYGEWSLRRVSDGYLRADGARFAQSLHGPDLAVSLPGFGQHGAVRCDRAGAVHCVEHYSIAHALRWAFEPAIPRLNALRSDFRGEFRISVDDLGVLVRGTVAATVTNSIELRLLPDVEWAHQPVLSWTVDGIEPDGYTLRFADIGG